MTTLHLLSTEEKFNLLQDYPGFVFIENLRDSIVSYHSYLTYPSGQESDHVYDCDRDRLIDEIFYQFETLVNNTCYIIERAKHHQP